MFEKKEPMVKVVGDLALDMRRARESKDVGRGRAVFLVGSGCSVTAGIPSAPGVAQLCATKLVADYSGGEQQIDDAHDALLWLQKEGHLRERIRGVGSRSEVDWAELYNYFFENHIKSPHEQKEFINGIIEKSGGGINWTHACIGELVAKGYVNTVLTTNFDQLVMQGIVKSGVFPVVADGLESLNRIDPRPKWPQVVQIHGSMHTYTLRNSSESIGEVADDVNTTAVIYSLLKEANLLVVVGYSGSDDGVMRSLRAAATALPKLVIYWVSYDSAYSRISRMAQELLLGENKFFLWGGQSDEFFGNLMEALNLGGPEWVKDPLGSFRKDSDLLLSPENTPDSVRILVKSYKSAVQFAFDNRGQQKKSPVAQAAVLAAEGDFTGALALLDSLEGPLDVEGRKLHASYSFERYRTSRTNEDGLEGAIAEFSNLVSETSGRERLEIILSLIQAELSLSEDRSGEDDDKSKEEFKAALSKVVEGATKWIEEYAADEYAKDRARLQIYKAIALQGLSDVDKNKVQVNLLEAESLYKSAIDTLSSFGVLHQMILEAKEGLATVSQVLGEAGGGSGSDVEKLKTAVSLLREVEKGARTNTRSLDDAGRLANLAGALKALASQDPLADKMALMAESDNLQKLADEIINESHGTAED